MTPTETSIPSPPPSLRPPRPSFNLLQLFAEHAWAARVWCGVAVTALAIALIEPYFIISAYRTPERVVILDEAGTYHVSPLLDFSNATKLHTSQTLLACLALLEKNPDGFDYPELLDKLFLPEALVQAKALQSAQAEELKTKQIHQKVEVFRLDVLQTNSDQVLVEATGQLLRLGLFQDEPFTEAQKFRARFTLLRNPNLTANSRFPLAVWKFSFAPL